MEKSTEQKMLSTMELMVENVMLLNEKVDALGIRIDEMEINLNERIDSVIRINALKEKVEMIKKTVGKHSGEIRNIQDYLHTKNKPGKGKIHFFKPCELE